MQDVLSQSCRGLGLLVQMNWDRAAAALTIGAALAAASWAVAL